MFKRREFVLLPRSLEFDGARRFPMRLRHHGPSIVIDAPAKLNLFLEVLQRRSDGYHDLDTVMVAIDVFDTLRLSPVDDSSIRLALSFDRRLDSRLRTEVPDDERNLCVRAARLMQAEYDVTQGGLIELHKRIPPQAGMGGGSSDAAATLAGLNQFWGLGLTSAELHQLAARLGSDVNFFLDSPAAAICRGRGEQVKRTETPAPLEFVLAIPESGLSTGAVFGALGTYRPSSSCNDIVSLLQAGRTHQIAAAMYNALEAPAIGLNPDIANLLSLMQSASRLPPRMTGSGSACFALCGGRAEANRLASRLRGVHQGPVWVCRSRSTMEAA